MEVSVKKLVYLILFALSINVYAGQVYDFAIVGDAGMKTASATQIRDRIIQSGMTQVISLGDNLYNVNNTYDDVWGGWSPLEFSMSAIGNHSLSYAAEVNYFNLPGEYYTKVYGNNIRFIVLNSDNPNTVQQQAQWFEQVISQSQESINIVIFHHPPYTISPYHTWQEKASFHKLIRPLIQRYSEKITALFTGHDHFASSFLINKIPWFLSGASLQAKSARPIDKIVEPGVRLKTTWYYDQTIHYSVLSIDDDSGEVMVKYYRASDDFYSCGIKVKPVYELDVNCL